MSIFFLKIYRFFNQHKYIALALLLALTGVFALLALHIHYEEDIAKFLPKNEKTARFQNIYQKISAQDRIIFLLTSKDSARKADIDTLEEAMDELAGNLKQISIERINSELCKILAEPLIYSNYRTPSFELFADELFLFRTLVGYLNIVNSKIQIPLVTAFSRLWYCGEEQNYPLNLVLVFDSPNIEEILEDLRFSKETILTAKEIYDFGHKIYDEIDEWRKCW